jgi:hypothetical protein
VKRTVSDSKNSRPNPPWKVNNREYIIKNVKSRNWVSCNLPKRRQSGHPTSRAGTSSPSTSAQIKIWVAFQQHVGALLGWLHRRLPPRVHRSL